MAKKKITPPKVIGSSASIIENKEFRNFIKQTEGNHKVKKDPRINQPTRARIA